MENDALFLLAPQGYFALEYIKIHEQMNSMPRLLMSRGLSQN